MNCLWKISAVDKHVFWRHFQMYDDYLSSCCFWKIKDSWFLIAHQIWAKPDQQFVWKCTETARQIKGQETMEIRWNVMKSLSAQGRTKFELKLIIFFFANARNLPNPLETRKQVEFNRANKFIRHGQHHNTSIYHHVCAIPWAVYLGFSGNWSTIQRSWNDRYWAENDQTLPKSEETINVPRRLGSILCAVCPEMHGNHKSVTDRWTDIRTCRLL